MILQYGVDQWFNSLSDNDAIVHLAFPLQSGNGFAYDTNSKEVYGTNGSKECLYPSGVIS